jgi:hypothetical protein
MKHWILAGSTAVGALIAGTSAFADVTPEDVWSNWQAAMASSGMTVATTDVSRDGDVLSVAGLTLTEDSGKGTFSASIDQIDFTDNGDGGVDITMSESYPILIKAPADPAVEGSKPTDLKITLTQPDSVLTASGTPEAISYDVDAPSITAKLESINGTDSSVVDLTAEAVMTNVIGSYLVEGDAAKKNVTSEYTAEKVSLTVAGKNPQDQSDLSFQGQMNGLTGKSTGTLLDMAGMADMGKALAAGFAANATFGYADSTFDMNVTAEGKPTHVSGSSGEGSLTFAMDASHLQYGASGKTVKIALQSPDIPFPQVDISYDEAAFNLDIPVAKSDAPANFAFLTKLVGFNVSDEIWGMFDPTSQLPHDGATIVIDAKGTATLKSDLFAEMEQGAEGKPPEADLNSLDITDLKASIAGAELTGAGAFTFDNSDKTTFEGVPLPTGKIDLKLTGAYTLLDKIVAMGFLKAEDVMQYKMMAGMFTNATPGKDELTSTLEFKDKGFYANGQRLQ